MAVPVCQLCGFAGDVHTALIRWSDGRDQFGAGPRCKDVEACRQRVEARGETWPVQDRADER